MAIAPSIFNRGDECVGVPIRNSASGMDADKMGYGGIGSLPYVALVVKFAPEFFPGVVGIIGPFQGDQGLSRIVRDTIAAEKVRPLGIVEIHSFSNQFDRFASTVTR
jgi:hypothetical protein